MLCIAAVVAASFYGGPITYSILFGLILIAPVSFIYLLTVYVFFKLYQVVQSKHISVYEPIPYYFVLQNEYLLNFCHIKTDMYTTFSYIENMREDREYELLPDESARYDTRLVSRYRGEYKVGIKDITITDYLLHIYSSSNSFSAATNVSLTICISLTMRSNLLEILRMSS